jgi:hypothetical protein
MDKENLVYTHNVQPLRRIKLCNLSKMDGTGDHQAKHNKPQ